MTKFLEYFPRVAYDLSNSDLTNYEIITNITFRIGIIKEVLSYASSYFNYTIKDGETPEIIAENVYNDPEAHWIILYANDIFDPQFDWPLNSTAFKNYLVDKYRYNAAVDLLISTDAITDTQVLSWTQDTTNAESVHHYEKQIIRYNSVDDISYSTNLIINGTNVASVLNSTLENVPYDFYTTANTLDPRALEYTGAYNTYEVGGKTIQETIRGAAITYYDYENELNENKRFIKVIKAEYYPQIIEEFKRLTGSQTESYIRRLI